MATPAISRVHLENILYATDFHGCSRAALPYALSIGRKYGSKIYVAHVVDVSPFASPAPTSALRAIEAQALREAKQAATEMSPLFGTVAHEAIIRKGNVWKEIAALVEQMRVDLIVTGTHGRSGIRKVVMGSVAEKIFRHSSCPVLTIGPHVRGDPDRFEGLHAILVPTDFSPESQCALSWAISLAEAQRSRLYLLHVVSAEADPDHPSLESALRFLIPPDTESGYVPKIMVEQGSPGTRILEAARELAVDLIVLGVKRPDFFHGTSTHQTMSTAYEVVSGSCCPVVTVRPPA